MRTHGVVHNDLCINFLMELNIHKPSWENDSQVFQCLVSYSEPTHILLY